MDLGYTEINFFAVFTRKSNGLKFRVVSGDFLTARKAIKHWKDNPECLELANRAISKFDLIKALLEKEG
jgi:hypothetical protein